MSADKPSLLYRAIKRAIKLVYRPYEFSGTENLPDGPAIIIGNHSQAHGPLVMELYAPRPRYIWCVHEMMSFTEVSAYAYSDFWSNKPKSVRWLYRILSYLIAPLAWVLFNNASVIPVYCDNRLISTFKESIARLDAGADIVVFPECYTERNNIVHEFKEGFANLAALYRQKTGKEVSFVPMYICPKLRKVIYGAPVRIDFDKPLKQEFERVRVKMMDDITALALTLPPHRVVPYPNVSSKYYPLSK